MKKALFISIILLLSACGERPLYKSSMGVLDYSQYMGKGFFITESNSVSFPYEPIGSLESTIRSGWVLSDSPYTGNSGFSAHPSGQEKYKGFQSAKIEDALKTIYAEAIKIGANGIINLKITYLPPIYKKDNSIIEHEGYMVTGMAIKR